MNIVKWFSCLSADPHIDLVRFRIEAEFILIPQWPALTGFRMRSGPDTCGPI